MFLCNYSIINYETNKLVFFVYVLGIGLHNFSILQGHHRKKQHRMRLQWLPMYLTVLSMCFSTKLKATQERIFIHKCLWHFWSDRKILNH